MRDAHMHTNGRPGPWGGEWAEGSGPGFGGPGFGGRRSGRGRGRFGGGPWGMGPGFGGGPWGGAGGPWRARRGDVRAAILALLTEKPMHGYEVIGEIDQRTEGAWRPSPGSVYPTLQMLEDEGLVAAEEVEGKRRFTLTDTGKAEAASADGPPPWEQVADGGMPGGMVEMGDALRGLMPAVKQVFREGTPAQQAKAAEVLAEAKRKLYEVLGS